MSSRWTFAAAAALAATVAVAEPARVTVAVDVSGLDDETARRVDAGGLQSALLVRLVQDGFAVVAPTASPDVLLSFHGAPEGVTVEVKTKERLGKRNVPLGEAPPPDLQQQLVQHASALIAEARSRGPRPPPPAAPAVSAPLPEPGARRLSMSLGASALWRSAVDPLVSVGARWGRRYGFALAGELSVAPSVGPGISVDELGVVAGADYRWGLRRGVDIEAGVRAGLWAQFYSVTDASASNTGGPTSAFLFELPVEVLSWISPRTAISFRAAPGIVTERVTHTEAGQVIWDRSVFRLAVGMTVQHVF